MYANFQNKAFDITVNTEDHDLPNGINNHGLQADINVREKLNVAILGTGNYGRAMTTRLQSVGMDFVIGSRHPVGLFEGKQLLSYKDAISKSNVIFLALPSHSYNMEIEPLKELLKNKIVVDVSNLDNINDPSNALKLQGIIPESYVIKALNTVSAYALENDRMGICRITYICGDNIIAKEILMQILRGICLSPIDKGELSSAVLIEKLPFQFFQNWRLAIGMTLTLCILVWAYEYVRLMWYYNERWRKGTEVKDLPLKYTNRVIAWLVIWLLTFTFIPGVLAGFTQICLGTKYIRFPNWLDKWLKCRKQLGLICLFLAWIHCCMSILLFASGEFIHFRQAVKIGNRTVFMGLNIYAQISFLFSTFALGVMSILGITSLPSVNMHMSWREWDFVHTALGCICLMFGLTHLLTLTFYNWTAIAWKILMKNPKGVMPHPVFLMAALPIIVLVLKFILMAPGISCHLSNIRKGKGQHVIHNTV